MAIHLFCPLMDSIEAAEHIFQGGYPPSKRGKVGEFDIGQGKIRETVVCL